MKIPELTSGLKATWRSKSAYAPDLDSMWDRKADPDCVISVIVPVYNLEKYVEKCVESLLAQTVKALEILLIDDGSCDRSGEICRRYAEKYHNVYYFYQENQGVSAARNRGLAQAKGDWILFVDGDDFVQPDLAEQLYQLTDGETDIVCCACRVYQDGKATPYEFFPHEFVCRTLSEKRNLFYQLMGARYGQENKSYVTAIGVPWGKLYRRAFLVEQGLHFHRKLRRMQDNVFNMEAFYSARTIRYVNAHLYNYRVEHIQTYQAAYAPEIYRQVLDSREAFFAQDPFFSTSSMLQFRNGEKAEFLSASLKNILLTSHSCKKAVPKIKKLLADERYQGILKEENVSGKQEKKKSDKKLKVIRFLNQYRMYRIMYYGLGTLWRMKNLVQRIRNS